jgi:signal peptidase II
MNPRNMVFVTTLVLGLAADQASKVWVWENLELHVDEITIIPGWFSIVHAQNTGAAFSTMEGQQGLFLVFTLIVVPVVLYLVRAQEPQMRFIPLSLGLVLAGAVGNGIDRLRLGYVVDFFKVFGGREPLRGTLIDTFGTNVWPIFNVADSMLLVGVSLFVLYWAMLRDTEVADEESTPEIA